MRFTDELIEKTCWKDKEIIRDKIPIGFENFPPRLQDICIFHIQLSI